MLFARVPSKSSIIQYFFLKNECILNSSFNFFGIFGLSAKEWKRAPAADVTAPGGVFALSGNETYVSISDNAQGPGLYHTLDSGETTIFESPWGFINTDVAKDNKGNSIITSGGAVFLSQNNGPFVAYRDPAQKNITPYVCRLHKTRRYLIPHLRSRWPMWA